MLWATNIGFRSIGRPRLILTVDVEEDMPDWKITPVTTTRNIEALEEFSSRMAAKGIRPTYLCNYPVSTQPRSAETLKKIAATYECELGTHLHAWNTPPFDNQIEHGQPWRGAPYYESELGLKAFEAKLLTVHAAVTDLAGRAPTCYRAGRFGIQGKALEVLVTQGYRVDSSVIPLSEHLCDGGPDHRAAPQAPYFPSFEDVTRPGDLPILEVPISVGLTRRLPTALRNAFVHAPRVSHLRGLLSQDYLGWIDYGWLYPARFNRSVMCRVASTLVNSGVPVLNVFLHSNELIRGASGRIRTDADIERMYSRCDTLIDHCLDNLEAVPATLTEFADSINPVPRAPSGHFPEPVPHPESKTTRDMHRKVSAEGKACTPPRRVAEPGR